MNRQLRKLHKLCQRGRQVPRVTIPVLLSLTILLIKSSKHTKCGTVDAMPYNPRKRTARAVVLGPGVANSVHIRVLLERLSGHVTTADGTISSCLSVACVQHENAIATFIDAENLHRVSMHEYETVLAIGRSPLSAVYIEAILANMVNENMHSRVSLPFARFHIESYRYMVRWVLKHRGKFVRLDRLEQDVDAGGELDTWVELVRFLDRGFTERYLRKRARCAFADDGLARELVLKIVPNVLYGAPLNLSRFTAGALHAVQTELGYESCVFGFRGGRECGDGDGLMGEKIALKNEERTVQ